MGIYHELRLEIWLFHSIKFTVGCVISEAGTCILVFTDSFSTNYSEFDFGDEDELVEKESVKTKMQVPASEITQPTVNLIE